MKAGQKSLVSVSSRLGVFIFNVIALIIGLLIITNHSANAGQGNSVDVKIDSIQIYVPSLVDVFAEKGIDREALQIAVDGFNKLKTDSTLINDTILTLIDFSKPSYKKRLYVLDVKNRSIILHTLVAHGKNTGMVNAEKFSNIPSSLQSSLGFYVTSNTYYGKHGYSLQIDGMEKGINSKARERAIVVHGAKYVNEAYVNRHGRIGRSFGCPAVSYEVSKQLIDLIKNKSCMFIYSKSDNYLASSPILNKITS